jgi:hypothetical protein
MNFEHVTPRLWRLETSARKLDFEIRSAADGRVMERVRPAQASASPLNLADGMMRRRMSPHDN